MKKFFILFFIIVLATFLRFWNLGEVPPGFYSDEAAFGYNAYSILKTGRDEYSRSFPLVFESFGDFKAPLYFYYLVPFIAIFGLNPWVVRASSALLGVLSVVLTFFLVRKLFRKESLAFLASFLLAISPFSLQFSRFTHEGNLASFLVILGTFFFLKGLENKKFFIISVFSFALSLYAYHNTRIFVPIFGLVIIFLYLEEVKKINYRWLFLMAILFSIMIFPLILVMFSPNSWARIRGTNILEDPGLSMKVNEEIGEDFLSDNWPNRILHNKGIVAGFNFLRNYLLHFSGDFIFVQGDPVKIYQTPNTGLLYWWQLPFLILGVINLISQKNKEKVLIFSWFLLAPLASSLTRFVPSASRSLLFLPTMEIFISFGILTAFSFWRKFKPNLIKYLTFFSSLFLIIFNFYYYFHSYYVHLSIRYARDWQDKVKEVVLAVKDIESKYDKIWISKNVAFYIHFLFFLNYPPEKYQIQAKPGPKDEYGFTMPQGFDKYYFGGLPTNYELEKNILYVANLNEISQEIKPLKIINYKDNKTTFCLFDNQSFIKNFK